MFPQISFLGNFNKESPKTLAKPGCMRLDYMAHSCFLLEHEGYRLLFDPYDSDIGYPAPNLYSVDLVVVSHDHDDHNAVNQVTGACQIARGVARRAFGPLVLDGEIGWHGEGCEADPISLTLLEWGNRRLAHFGDLGCELEESHKQRFQDLDLLLIPCGGGYTINGPQAAEVVRQLRPKVVVPMHYQTPFLSRERFPNFQTAEPFLSACREFCTIEPAKNGWVNLNEVWSKLDTEQTLVLDLQHQMA